MTPKMAATAATRTASPPELVLRFDFHPIASKFPTPSPTATQRTAPQSIKDAIVRWLDEQL
jgi:hypothetical protein